MARSSGRGGALTCSVPPLPTRPSADSQALAEGAVETTASARRPPLIALLRSDSKVVTHESAYVPQGE